MAIVANKLRGSVCFTATIRDLTSASTPKWNWPARDVRQADGLPNRSLLLDRVQRAWPGPSARVGCSP